MASLFEFFNMNHESRAGRSDMDDGFGTSLVNNVTPAEPRNPPEDAA